MSDESTVYIGPELLAFVLCERIEEIEDDGGRRVTGASGFAVGGE